LPPRQNGDLFALRLHNDHAQYVTACSCP